MMANVPADLNSRPSTEPTFCISLARFAEDLVKKGDMLEYGKTVLIDTASCWNTDAQRIHDEVIALTSERGF